MKKLVFIFALLFPLSSFAAAPEFSVSSETPLQGETILIRIENASDTSKVSKITFGTTPVKFFLRDGTVSALYGVDINLKAGEYLLTAVLSDGTQLQRTITVAAREKYEEPLGIPEKLGGNTAASQTKLVSTLAQENAILASLATHKKTLWTKDFIFPVESPFVTDPYGYTRTTGQYSIAHKGVDFRAGETTKVLAMNRGVVRLVKTFRNYGKTVVVDHGQGVMTFYMHLSKIKVNQGELVLPGRVLGYAGQTGYAEQPHLHLTVRIGNISIDPMQFLALFK